VCPGQECFPGGLAESGDTSPADTALREAEEEIDLDRRRVEVVCCLPPLFALVGGLMSVTAVITLLRCPMEELHLVPNKAEVDCCYWVPLKLFVDTKLGRPDTEAEGGVEWRRRLHIHHVDPKTGSHDIWGLTSRLAVTLSAIAHNRLPSFYYKPLFSSKISREGEDFLVTYSQIALTQRQAETIPMPPSKL